MSNTRWDETWHRLREWTSGQGPSERLAAQVLLAEGVTSLDPSHPLGGPDGGKDALCDWHGATWAMAVYFPRGQNAIAAIQSKLKCDAAGAASNNAEGIAFVTNQELTLSERKLLRDSVAPLKLELFHLERLTAILDRPELVDVRRQFLGITFDDAPQVNFGGYGGMAPGAGGGGGGAIGTSAQGGDGGRGGRMFLSGLPAIAPGAGGGGAGSVGEGAIGGDGGAGGEMVRVEIGPEHLAQLNSQGFHRMEFRVGEGGKDGGPGEDTIVNLLDVNGKVLESIVARGGRPQTSSRDTTAHGRSATSEDVARGLRVSSLMLAECVHLKNGLLYVLGGNWEFFEFDSVPFEAVWPLICVVETKGIAEEDLLRAAAVVRDPNGFQVASEPFLIIPKASAVSRPQSIIALHFTASTVGVWNLSIEAGDVVLGTLPIEIRKRC